MLPLRWLVIGLMITTVPACQALAAGEPGRLDVRYLPGYDRVWVDELQWWDAAIRQRAHTLKLELVAAEGGAVFRTEVFELTDGVTRDQSIEQVKPPGEFTARGTVLDAAGAVVHEMPGVLRMQIFNAETEDGKDFRFITTFGPGDEPFAQELDRWLTVPDEVQPPFTPLECVENTVSVWGRDTELSPMGLPEQVTVYQPEPTLQSQWQAVLAEPVRLVVVRGRRHVPVVADAQDIAPSGGGVRATWGASGRARGLSVKLEAVMEYDGVCVYDLQYGPAAEPVECDGLYLEIPLRAEQATLMHVLSDSPSLEYSGAVPEGEGIVWDSAERVNRKLYGTFRCMAWVGTEDRGLCWFGDSDRGYTLDDYRPAMAVRREGGQVILQVRIVNFPTTISEMKSVRFGMLATPVKPLPDDWRRWIFPHWRGAQGMPHLFQQVQVGQSHPPHSLGAQAIAPQDWDATKTRMAELRERINPEAIYMEYWCSDLLTLGHPEMDHWAGEWARPSHDCWDTRSPHFTGYNRVYSIVNRSTPSLLGYRLWMTDQRLKRLGLMSFYEDNAQQRVQFDLAKGIGYVREDGKRQPEFDALACRSYYRRLAQVFRDNGQRNLATVHKSYSMLIPAFTHVAVAIDGEQPGQNSVDEDYIDVWRDKLAYFRSHVMGRQYGVVPAFLSEIRIKADEDPDGKFSRAMMALMLIHDVPVWPAWQRNMTPILSVWRVKDEFGFGRRPMSLHPYWASERYRAVEAGAEDVYVTVWRAPDAALMVASNFGEAQTVRLAVDLAKLGLTERGGLTVTDAETGESIAHEAADSFGLPMARHDFRLIHLKSAGRDVVARGSFDEGFSLAAAAGPIEPAQGERGELVPGVQGTACAGPPALTWQLPVDVRAEGGVSLWVRPGDWALGDRPPLMTGGEFSGRTDQGLGGRYLKVEDYPIGDGQRRDLLQLRIPAEEGKDNGFALNLYSVGDTGLVWSMTVDSKPGGSHVTKAVPADRMGDWNPHGWHHVAATWKAYPGHDGLFLFIDGRDWGGAWAHVFEDASHQPPTLTLLGPEHSGHTIIDELVVYTRLLEDSEVREMYRVRAGE